MSIVIVSVIGYLILTTNKTISVLEVAFHVLCNTAKEVEKILIRNKKNIVIIRIIYMLHVHVCLFFCVFLSLVCV